jgi:hypothetical protein
MENYLQKFEKQRLKLISAGFTPEQALAIIEQIAECLNNQRLDKESK